MSHNEIESVLIEEIGESDLKLGVITLNAPEKLNAVDLMMLQKIGETLSRWKSDSRIAAVFMHSSHGKAFCAGGDVKNLVLNLKHQGASEVASDFFTTEYFVDHEIHEYPKPVICWAHGVTMGGGIGLMNGCSFRVVNETSLLAMPEISIGLFPDVGASYFLNLFSHGLGLYLGLTGHRFSGHDAIDWEMADYFIPQSKKHNILSSLSKMKWTKSTGENSKLIDKCLGKMSDPISERDVPNWDHLGAFNFEDLCDELRENIHFSKGSPLSRRLIFDLLKWGRGKTLRECFEMEWVLAQNCAVRGDFEEGVKALLIEKTKNPRWKSPADHESFFNWKGPNLLAQKFDEAGY